MVTATVFATWFGAETVLGISATFVKEGLGGVVADPFGASLCLILAGLFFARKLYRMNLLTIGDYYRLRYNRTVELITTLCIVISYLGWVSAQIMALGLVFNVVTGGAITQETGMIIGAAIVLTYTMFGGMWSVAMLDFVQMTVIMVRHAVHCLAGQRHAGGVGAVVDHAQAAGKLRFLPRGRLRGMGALHRRLADHDAGLHPAAGRVPAHDLGQERKDRGARLGAGRLALFLLRLRADVPGLFGDADRSRRCSANCSRRIRSWCCPS